MGPRAALRGKARQYAAVIAAMRCDELRSASDFEGARNFQAIIERMNWLFEAPAGTLHRWAFGSNSA